MEVERNIIMGKAGGNASKNAKTYKISIPTGMLRELGVTEYDRSVVLSCENGAIVISKKQ